MTSAMSAHPWVWPSISPVLPCHQAPVSAWGALHVTSYLEHEDWWHQYGNDGDYASHIISCRGENVTICYKNIINNVSSGGKRSLCVTCPAQLVWHIECLLILIKRMSVKQKEGTKIYVAFLVRDKETDTRTLVMIIIVCLSMKIKLLLSPAQNW